MAYDRSFGPNRTQCMDSNSTFQLFLETPSASSIVSHGGSQYIRQGKQGRLQSLEGFLPLLGTGPCCGRSSLDSLGGRNGGG